MSSVISRILISGVSGMIGTALTSFLAGRGIDPVTLVRGKMAANRANIYWDPSAPRPVEELEKLEGVDAAIHLSGANVAAKRWSPAYQREIFSSRVETTHALVRVLRSLKRPPAVLISASAIGIYGDRGEEKLTEHSAPGTGFLAETCCAWEAAAEAARDAQIRVAYLRLGVVLDPDGGALGKVLPLFRAGLGGKLGNGSQWMSWITLSDVVRVVLHVLEGPAIHGPVNVVAPHPVRNAEYTHALGSALHRPAIVAAPAFALRFAMGQMADEALLASARVLPEKLETGGFRFDHPEIEPALKAMLRRR